jgi:hypothetical protein
MSPKRGVAGIRWWMLVVAMVFLLAGLTPPVQAGRDRGVNQPGAVGNRGCAGGSARQTRSVHDPGVNQPGRTGNRR